MPKNLKLYLCFSWILAPAISAFTFFILLQSIFVHKPKIKSRAQEVIIDISITNFTEDFIDKKEKKIIAAKSNKNVAVKTFSSLWEDINITADHVDTEDILYNSEVIQKPLKVRKAAFKKAVKKQIKVITVAKPNEKIELQSTNNIRLRNVKANEFEVTDSTSSNTRTYKYAKDEKLDVKAAIVEMEGIEDAYIDGIRDFIYKHIELTSNDINNYMKLRFSISTDGQFSYQILGVQGSKDFVNRVKHQIEILQKKGLAKPKKYLSNVEVNIYGKKGTN